MFWTLIGIPTLLPRVIDIVDKVAAKTAAHLKERKRVEKMKTPVAAGVVVKIPILVDLAQREEVQKEIQRLALVAVAGHPAVQGAYGAIAAGVITTCATCGWFGSAAVVREKRCHPEGNRP